MSNHSKDRNTQTTGSYKTTNLLTFLLVVYFLMPDWLFFGIILTFHKYFWC